MKRKSLEVALLVSLCMGVIGSGRASAANAEGFVGTVCWKLNPFADVIKLDISVDGTSAGVHGRWTSGSSYSVAVVGVLALDNVNTANGNADLHLTWADYLDPIASAGFFHAKLTLSTLNGTWKFKSAETGTNTGTFTSLATCPTTATPMEGVPAMALPQ